MVTTYPISRHHRFQDLTGRKFDRLTVESYAGPGPNRRATWNVRCRCKAKTVLTVAAANLTSGNTRSCGCKRLASLEKRCTVHGHARATRVTAEFRAWLHMRQRCLNASRKDFKYYGGRGVTVHPGWVDDFPAFLAHVGPKPSKAHSLDRYPDKDGNYEPGNVRWATHTEQMQNTRRNRLITVNGVTKCVSQWARCRGCRPSTIHARLKSGWTEDDAVGVEVGARKPPKPKISREK